ncbi:MAG: lycopene cyclase domain-containing protein [Candidatus Kapaibacterium sp.]
MNLTYLLINLGVIAVPLFLSFERKIYFASKWKYLLPAIIVAGGIFIAWDVRFTAMGVWEFNREYISGIYLLNLPLGEWLFFLTVPFACVFIYEVLNYYIKKDILGPYSRGIALINAALLLIIAAFTPDKIYTFVTFLSLGVFLLIHVFVIKSSYLGRFYLMYFVHLIPFLIVNGILTALPVVIYNNAENLSLRIYTIPIEDTQYSMLLLLLVISIYEKLRPGR